MLRPTSTDKVPEGNAKINTIKAESDRPINWSTDPRSMHEMRHLNECISTTCAPKFLHRERKNGILLQDCGEQPPEKQ
jgi:hypothetical protein